MRRQTSGFSLIELLIALLIVLATGMMTFQLFRENERVIRDQNLIMEMQQTARVVISQIADEIRMAGQSVPVFAATFDSSPSEATAIFLATSAPDRIDVRAGLSNIETVVTTASPIDLSFGAARSLSIQDSSGLTAGKYIYLWGPCGASWSWARAQLISVTSTTITFIPQQIGGSASAIHFTSAPTVFLEEAVSIYLNGNSVRRATSSDFSNPANPTWNPSNEIGRSVTALTFNYYDTAGNPVMPVSLATRTAISRVDIHLTVQTTAALASGRVATYSLALRTIPRNVRIRSAD